MRVIEQTKRKIPWNLRFCPNQTFVFIYIPLLFHRKKKENQLIQFVCANITLYSCLTYLCSETKLGRMQVHLNYTGKSVSEGIPFGFGLQYTLLLSAGMACHKIQDTSRVCQIQNLTYRVKTAHSGKTSLVIFFLSLSFHLQTNSRRTKIAWITFLRRSKFFSEMEADRGNIVTAVTFQILYLKQIYAKCC